MKYHALFVIFEKASEFEIVVCCKLSVALYGLKHFNLSHFFYHCNAYHVSIVFHFSLEGRALFLIVTVPCHCLYLTLQNLILVLVYFGQHRL